MPAVPTSSGSSGMWMPRRVSAWASSHSPAPQNSSARTMKPSLRKNSDAATRPSRPSPTAMAMGRSRPARAGAGRASTSMLEGCVIRPRGARSPCAPTTGRRTRRGAWSALPAPSRRAARRPRPPHRRGRGRRAARREGAGSADQAPRRVRRPVVGAQGERAPRGLMTQPSSIDVLARPAPARAGRDLPIAIAVGLGLLGLVAVSLSFRKEGFILLALVACGAGLWELAQALTRRGIHIPLLPLLVGTAGILVSSYTGGPEALLVAFMLTAGGVVVWRVLDGGGAEALRDAAAATFAAAYIPFMAGFVMLMLDQPGGDRRVALFVLLAVASDTGGYTAGVLLGRNLLAPSVSPKKTWEGLAGSLLLASAVGAVGMVLAFDANPLIGIALGLASVLTATLGDLAESLIKRDLELKDMGSLLPGHGGVLDRIDSLLLSAPLVYLVLLVTVPGA